MKAKLTLLLGSLLALAGASEERRPPAEATLQLISLAGDLDDLALWDGRKATAVRLSADFFGPRLHYAGSPRLQLIRPDKGATTKDAAAGKPAKETANPAPPGPVVAWFDLPTGVGPRSLILLVRPEPDRNGIWGIEDENQRFPSGSIRFLNFCDFPLMLGEGEKATRLPAKGSAVVRPGVPAGRYYDTPIYSEEDQTRRLAYHLHFFFATDRRTLLLVLPGEKGSGLVRLQPVEDPDAGGKGGSPHDAKIKAPAPRR